MTGDDRKHSMKRWVLEMWGSGNLALIDEFVSPDYVYRAPGTQETRGAKALKDLVTFYRTAFPDLTNTVEEQIAEGDKVVTRGITRGTHRGPLGDVPASGKRTEVPWVLISRFDGAKIAEEWEIFDSLGFMQQIGAVPGGA